MNDLFGSPAAPPRQPKPTANQTGDDAYSAADIEVLEGLEPVRRRPGMYIGGTDEIALHHLAAEVIDNAMDEAVAGHASEISVTLEAGNWLTVRDNGRGIPVDSHPKFPKLSALEVILTTLHSGGKFGGDTYATAGGLHGVGSSVVNALSEQLIVEVARARMLWRQTYARGVPTSPLTNLGPVHNRRGTQFRFKPDPEIFAALSFSPARLFKLCRAKAYLFRGVRIRWTCDPALLGTGTPHTVPADVLLHFPGGLADSLAADLGDAARAVPAIWAEQAPLAEAGSRAEWAIAWLEDADQGTLDSYCNTIPTLQGGTHETGLRAALVKGLRAWGEQRNHRRIAILAPEDAIGPLAAKLSVFLRSPQFQGQTKEKLTSADAARLVEAAVRDRFDHFLAADPAQADALLAFVLERGEARLRRKEVKETQRKSATRRLRLPGKLIDCASENIAETELFLVEGDSAGGSAKQARNRDTQAILPLRGKILNVASASADKLRGNQELRDLTEALGCGAGERCDLGRLRYGRVIIMTDADVDGAHIASLLMTFFYREIPPLIRDGRLFLAQPPLYRLTQGARSVYAMDDKDRDRRLKQDFKPGARIDVSRFKGLGEMPAIVLKETTMDPQRRTLLKVVARSEDRAVTERVVESLMGRRPELRFAFIQEHAGSVAAENVDV